MERAVAGDALVLAGAACELKRAIDFRQLKFRHGVLGKHFRPVSLGKGLIATTNYSGIDHRHHLIAGLVEEGLAISIVNSSKASSSSTDQGGGKRLSLSHSMK